MAFLIDGIKLDGNLSLDMFYPESFRTLSELLIIHEENLIVIKELLSGGPCDTFFTLDTLERIDPFKRYKQENGKAFIERKDDLTIVTIVSIEMGTMTEFLLGVIFKNDKQIFKSRATRYSSYPTESVYQLYLDSEFRLMELTKDREDFFEKFINCSFDEKVSKLRMRFLSMFRKNCEIGYFPAEYFLPQELFNLLEGDKEFRKALLEVFELEKEVLDQSVSITFDGFIKHYTKIKEN